MRNSENLSDQIDLYLSGKLEGEDLARFRALIEKDPGLEKEIQLHREIRKTILGYDEIELRKKLEKVHAEYHTSRKPVLRKILLYGVRAAAMVLLVVGSYFVYTHWMGPYDNMELFNRYYKPYEVQAFRSADTPVNKLYGDAIEYYRNGEFLEAISLFEKVIGMDQNRMDANLMSGISKIEIKRYTDAGKNFRKIIDHRDNLYLEHAEWYLGLCYLTTGEADKAREQFMMIYNKEGFYSRQAGKILRKIRD